MSIFIILNKLLCFLVVMCIFLILFVFYLKKIIVLPQFKQLGKKITYIKLQLDGITSV